MLSASSIIDNESNEDIDHYDDNRVLPRISVLWRAFILVKGHKFSCQIRNLSTGGLKIKLDIPFKEDVEAIVELPKFNVALKAKIAWQSGGFFGLEFLDDHAAVRDQFVEGAAIIGVDAVQFMNALD